MRQYLLDIISDRRRGPVAAVIKSILWTLSQLYCAAARSRLALYHRRIFRQRSLPCLTISVGNITVGGTGKTPLVEMLASALSDRGRNVAVLSRGYKSKRLPPLQKTNAAHDYSPRIVSDGQKVLLDSACAGDEPYLLASNLKRVIVLVDKNRIRAGRYAISRFAADTLILDDGFQYLALRRTLDIVLIDSTNPFGNGHLLPRGLLREPLSGLKRAHFFFLTKTTGVQLKPIRDRLRHINPKAGIVESVHQPLYLEEGTSGRRQPPGFLRGKQVYVLSAIASPLSFETAIERLGARIKKSIRFVDHHRFSQQEIERILSQASADAIDCIVTTQKDAVRLPPLKSTSVPLLFLRVAIQITRGSPLFADFLSRTSHL